MPKLITYRFFHIDGEMRDRWQSCDHAPSMLWIVRHELEELGNGWLAVRMPDSPHPVGRFPRPERDSYVRLFED